MRSSYQHNSYERNKTRLADSLFFRVRNCRNKFPGSLNEQEENKVNYLANQYWDLLLQHKIDPNDPEYKKKFNEQANNIDSIILTIYSLNQYNVNIVMEILETLFKQNSKINIIIITNKIRDDLNELQAIFKRINVAIVSEDTFIYQVNELGQQEQIKMIYQRNDKIHGKLWMIKYKQALRVCISTANLSTFDWTTGGNGFWKRDFQKLLKINPHQNSAKEFTNQLTNFLYLALAPQNFNFISHKIALDFKIYNFDKLQNIHLIICPSNQVFPQDDRTKQNYGLNKIRKIIRNIRERQGKWDSFKYKNINIISPFISTGGYQDEFVNLLNHTITAFSGRQPLDYENFRQQKRKDKQLHIHPLRFCQLTNLQVFLAYKYQLQTKMAKLESGNKQLGLLQNISDLRRNQDGRAQAFEIIGEMKMYAQFHGLGCQDSKYMKYSNFTVHHTKLIVCTHKKTTCDERPKGFSDILYIGSNNYTPYSWGVFDDDAVQYQNLQIGVLIEVSLEENVEDYIPINFNTSNHQAKQSRIDVDEIFTNIQSGRLRNSKKKCKTFEECLENQAIFLDYKKDLYDYFKSNFDQRYRNTFQMVFDYPITVFRETSYDFYRKPLRESIKQKIIYGTKDWFDFLKSKVGDNMKDNLVWIADVAIRLKSTHQILVIWYFDMCQYYELTKQLKQYIKTIKNSPRLMFLPIKDWNLESQNGVSWQLQKAKSQCLNNHLYHRAY